MPRARSSTTEPRRPGCRRWPGPCRSRWSTSQPSSPGAGCPGRPRQEPRCGPARGPSAVVGAEQRAGPCPRGARPSARARPGRRPPAGSSRRPPDSARPSSTVRYGSTGRRTSNRLPCPTCDSSVIRPPKSSTMRRHSVSPRPVPSSLAAPRPPCWKDSKISSRSSGAMPMPVSDTDTTSSPASRWARTPTAPPAGVNFTALPTRLTTTCLKRSSSDSTSPTSSATSRVRSMPPAGGPLAHHRHGVLQRGGHREHGGLQPHLPRLDLREVEDLVEQLEQVATRAEDVAEVLLLPLVELAEHATEEHVGEADHRVQRGPQLVGHAGEELRLVPAGHLEVAPADAELAEHARVDDGQRRLVGERLEQRAHVVGEVAGDAPAHDQSTDELALAQHRDGEHRAPAGAVELLEVGVPGDRRRGRPRSRSGARRPPCRPGRSRAGW